ncbi:MAG TPA: flippase activity-associated protein Agl23 [Aggregatilineales bacterium]|nr:flippase activity-associated protein Agl23 [Aggregatilineales bacterium]
MSTIEQAPPSATPGDYARLSNPLAGLMTRFYAIDWVTVYYVGIFIAAVLTRFIGLGDRVMSHDESLHVKYSYDLYKGNGFQHTPLMHGPILFHMTALMYFLFGDSDFSARLYPAILGVIMVLMPKLLFERWLGKRGAMVASLMLLISPMILYHNRYIREDTPSIFFTLLMVYAIFAYVDGLQPRKIQWLILLSAAAVLSLGSKEVGFMYVAIFGSAVTLFWLLQVVQGLRAGVTKPIVGWVIGGVLGIAIIAAISIAAGGVLSAKLSPSDGQRISTAVLAAPIAVILVVIVGLLLEPVRKSLGAIGARANSIYKLVMAGVILGIVGTLFMSFVLAVASKSTGAPLQPGQVAPPTLLGMDQGVALRVIEWTAIAIVLLLLAVIIPALIKFAAWPRLPWADFAVIILTALVVGTVLTYFEERSKTITENTIATINNSPIVMAWVLGALAIAGLLALRFTTPFFDEMKRFPVFDVLIVLGSLILPWLAAFPVFLSGYKLDLGGAYPPETVVACLVASIPFFAVAIVAGLCWNPQTWLLCAGTFYAIFVFFFTTVFTNMMGIATGLIGSLGYWLAQQGVRRGSQPQYFYFLQLGVYEFLPVAGAAAAGLAGIAGLWGFRQARMAEVADQAEAALQAEPMPADGAAPTASPSGEEMPAETQADGAGLVMFRAETPEPAVEAAPAASFEDDFSALGPASGTADATQVGVMTVTPGAENPIEPIPEPILPLEEVISEGMGIPGAEVLRGLPFLPFVGYWAGLMTLFLTIAGEKMPWMTTHLAIPLIFLSAWYMGVILDQVDWGKFFKQSWAVIVLVPIFLIGLSNLIGEWMGANPPLHGNTSEQLLATFGWFGAALLTVLVAYGIFWVFRRIGGRQLFRVSVFAVFIFLALMTARAAFRAAFINYDYPTEFLVYAHGAPSNKLITNFLMEVARRTSDGNNLKVAYDDKMSWPGEWYFRNFPNRTYLGDPTGRTDLDQFVAVAVGDANKSKVDAQLQDNYIQIRYSRLWWPMQDYFDVSFSRLDNIFAPASDTSQPGWVDPGKLRAGIWDIWWNRDYTTYGDATNKDFKLSDWPVTDWMVFYVRKDIAQQIWTLGNVSLTNGQGTTLTGNPFDAVQCPTCMPDLVFNTSTDPASLLAQPHGMSLGPDGNLYVADTNNSRIAVFSPDGKFVRTIGGPVPDPSASEFPAGTFKTPWDVTVAADGSIIVADTWAHRIQVFDKNGVFKTQWGHFEQIAPGQAGSDVGFFGPRAVALDAAGQLYVADTGNKRIRVYTQTGQLLRTIGTSGTQDGALNEPVGLTIDNKTGELYVADSWNKRIQVFDMNTGLFKRQWKVTGWAGSSNDTGTRPYLTLDRTGTRLFVTVPDLSKILVYDTQGGAVLTFGRLGQVPVKADNEFVRLGGILADSTGRLFITDPDSGRIVRFNYLNLPNLYPPAANGGSSGGPATAAATYKDF